MADKEFPIQALGVKVKDGVNAEALFPADLWAGVDPRSGEKRSFGSRNAAEVLGMVNIQGYVSHQSLATMFNMPVSGRGTPTEHDAVIYPTVTKDNAAAVMAGILDAFIEVAAANPSVVLERQQVRSAQVYFGRSIPNVSNNALKNLIDKAQWVCQDLGGQNSVEALRKAGNVLEAEYKHTVPLTRDEVRDIFLKNGFTVKAGESDLKPYVFAAAEAVVIEALKKTGV